MNLEETKDRKIAEQRELINSLEVRLSDANDKAFKLQIALDELKGVYTPKQAEFAANDERAFMESIRTPKGADPGTWGKPE